MSFHLHCLYFMLGMITDFTDTSELVWLKRFAISEIQVIVAIINFAWSPIRYKIATVSDTCVKRCNPYTQCGVALIIPSILWLILSHEINNENKWALLLCLILAEFGPSINHTVLDGIRSRYYHQTKHNIVPSTERVRLLGSFIANVIAGYVLQTKGIRTVFEIQAGLLVFTIVLAFLGRFYFGITITGYTIVQDLKTEFKSHDGYPVVTLDTKPTISRSFMLFMTLLAALPTGGSALFYYLTGPVQLSTLSFNVIDAIGAIVMIISTYVGSKPHWDKRWVCFIAAISGTCIQIGMYVLVTRLHVQYMSDFIFLLVLSIFGIFINGVMNVSYMSTAVESTTNGSEAGDYAYYTVIPSIGRFLKIIFDTGLTMYYKIDHDQFENLPKVLTITIALSLIAIEASTCVRK